MASTSDPIETIARRVRYRAALELIERISDVDVRYGLLADVIDPRPAFDEASRRAAREILARRQARDPFAA